MKTRVKRQKQPLKLFCKKVILINFSSFTGEHLCWSLFLIELQTFIPTALLKRDSNTNVSLWKIFKNTWFEVCDCLLLKPVLSSGLTLLAQINTYALAFVSCFTVPFATINTIIDSLCYYWYWYNQKQSSRAVLQKRCSCKFRKIHKKTPKKGIPAEMFSCQFCEISHSSFFKVPFARLLLHKYSFCLLSYHDLLPFQKRYHRYFLPEYFFSLICRLGTKVSSIFQTLSHKPIFNPVEHPGWKIVNSLKLLSIFAKKAPL